MSAQREQELRGSARAIADAALKAVDPFDCVSRALDELQEELSVAGRILVTGAGKASAAMARAVEQRLGDRIASGWINTKHGHGFDLERIVCHECGHPVPDADGVEGSRRILEIADSATQEDVVLCLISGGASALMPLPVEGVSLGEKQETTKLLLDCGANIHQINAVRKHLSRIKGGRLARAAAPARVISLILSDVVGDDIDVIGSGPTAPDRSTFGDARAVLERYEIGGRVPAAVRRYLEGTDEESPKPGDPIFGLVQNQVVVSNRQALDAAAGKAREMGFHTLLLAATIEGETRDVARMHAAILREVVKSGNPVARPACLLSGGETTVTIRGRGKGGRNQEFALAAALDIEGLEDALVLSFGTDGTDGPTNAAGALADGQTIRRAAGLGFDPVRHLVENNAYPLFEALGDLLITGPTRTNVMDLHILLAA